MVQLRAIRHPDGGLLYASDIVEREDGRLATRLFEDEAEFISTLEGILSKQKTQRNFRRDILPKLHEAHLQQWHSNDHPDNLIDLTAEQARLLGWRA
jgi:hypothetical protein